MGYDLHITRAERWTESEDSPIRADEWLAVVAADPDFELTGVASVDTPEGSLRYENPGLVRWTGHPDQEEVWFDFRDGHVVVKNPDEATIARMIAVAGRLGARVLGDDGETYESPGMPPKPASAPLSTRIASLFSRLWPRPAPSAPLPPFGVGDRVRDGMNGLGTVVAMDARAMHGLGTIQVRFDDGRELSYAMLAHDLTQVEEPPG